MGPEEWALLVLLATLWGGSFFLAKVAVAEISPLTLVLGRVGIAAVALLAVVRLAGWRMPRERGVWLAFLGMGALNNLLPFALIFWAQTSIASGLASILNATTPLFGVLLAHVLTRDERLTPARLAGALTGLGGVALMIGSEAITEGGFHLLPQLACLLAAVSYAMAGIYGRRFGGMAPLVVAAGQVSASTLMALPVVLLVDRPWTLAVPSAAAWAAVVALALVCTALGYVLFFRILKAAGATNILLVTLLVPVSAILLGSLILGESLAARHVLGMALIAVGLACIDGRLPARLRRLRASAR